MLLAFLSPVFLIVYFEIVILIHKSLPQYAPTVYIQQPEPYTRAAYFEHYDDQEYVWPTENNNFHRKRKKYSYYSGSSEFDYETKRLKCKCSCRKCRKNKHSYYDQQKDCCFSFCIKCLDKSNAYDFAYMSHTTTTETSPESYGNLCPSLPWFECYQEIMTIDVGKIIEGYTIKYHKKKDKTDKDNGKGKNNTTTTATKTTTETNTTTATNTTTSGVSESTVPYRGNDKVKLLLNSLYIPKKKQCLRNNCLRDNTGRKSGRYFYNDLVMRPTVGSTLYDFANY